MHHGAVAVSRPDGTLIAWSGEIDRPFYLRSSAKPFQAHISQESGAGLAPVELAMACASHRGEPVHVALVESILANGGLSPDDLRCPFGWPLSAEASRRLSLSGETKPRRIWHNCSGKHAGFLRACVARDWPRESYLDPNHPLQRQIIGFVSELGEHDTEPVGVDGCGAPVLRTTVRAMALLFARLATEPSLREVFTVMHRYPALVANYDEGDASIAIATNAAAKSGAQGCLGVAVDGRLGVAVKSWDGLGDIATIGAIAALRQVGELPGYASTTLESVSGPPVLGGEAAVGVTESRLELSCS